jgi:hypothetical protein
VPVLPDKQPDQDRIVASLAAQCHVPVSDVASLYQHERDELASGAKVTRFLHIFAIRNVLAILRKQGHGGRVAPLAVRAAVN